MRTNKRDPTFPNLPIALCWEIQNSKTHLHVASVVGARRETGQFQMSSGPAAISWKGVRSSFVTATVAVVQGELDRACADLVRLEQ